MVFFAGEHLTLKVKNNGSALIIVLWTLVLISFLAGQYLDHNRGKASIAENAWNSLRQKEAVDSVLHLFATDSWPVPGQENRKEKWNRFSPNEIDLWVKVEGESNRININTATDSRIREKILELSEDDLGDEADQLADAILDWRDTDLLVRTNGAEADFYDTKDVGYRPANGPFKVLTELLLIRGVTPGLFWGDPMVEIPTGAGRKAKPMPLSLLDEFTVYPKNIRRVSIVIPGKGNGYSFITVFLEMKNARWDILQLCRSMLVTSGGERPLDQTETEIELS
jgi:general secretion pathway protein K